MRREINRFVVFSVKKSRSNLRRVNRERDIRIDKRLNVWI